MSFKNALKNVVAHFGNVWSLLLYIVVFAAVITGLSLPFILPVIDAFADAGVFETIGESFRSLFSAGGWDAMWSGFYETYGLVRNVFASNGRIVSLTMLFLILVMVVLFRFFLGLYEIPLATVVDGAMSCNSRYGFAGKFFSTLFTSIRYSFFKMIYTIAVDVLFALTVYGLGRSIGLRAALPFAIMLVLLLFGGIRFSLVACWAPAVASGEYGVFKGFVYSAKVFGTRFAQIFSTYFMALLLLVAVGGLITLFTLGVGMIILLPFSATYLCFLNSTVFYNKTGRRYYVDGMVVTPPTEDVL